LDIFIAIIGSTVQKKNMKYQNEIYLEESIHTPLLNSNHKKLPRNRRNYRNPRKSSENKNEKENTNKRNLLSKFYYWFCYYLTKIFPCCYKYKEEHLCYFPKLEDRIIIEHNSFWERDGLPLIFWDQNYEEEEVFFDPNEQKIINMMKEEIKKYQ